MIRRGSDTLLFDCGEGAQQQMMRSRCGFIVNAVFISHWHADHFLGLFGLVQTMSFNGRTEPLTIYGPEWVHEFVTILRQVARFNLKFSLESVELVQGSWVRFNGYTVTAFAAKHGMPALGYILEEDPRPGRFNRERAIELGVPPGPLFGRLQRGETIRLGSGEKACDIMPEQVMGTPRPGRKIVYTGDTRANYMNIREIASDADVLIHDATYDESEAGRGEEFYHATAAQAGEAASVLNARMLVLVIPVHGIRCTGPSMQRRNFPPIIAPDDLDVIEIGRDGFNDSKSFPIHMATVRKILLVKIPKGYARYHD
jgi:ribonuclease Z